MSLPLRAKLEDTPPLQDPGLEVRPRLADAIAECRAQTFDYQHQEAPQTLRDGLREYYSSNAALLAPANLSNEIAEGLRAHDAAHVVFGCDTSVRGEVMLARWSLLGSREGIAIYARGLRSKETRFLFGDFFKKLRPLILLVAVIDGALAFFRSLRMPKQWPARDWEHYSERPLAEIRGEFGFRVI